VDEEVIKYYRKLLRTGFENAGSLSDPSVFLDSGHEGHPCGHADYMQIFVNVSDDRIDDIKYLCTCDPTANVAVEVLCTLLRGKRLEEAEAITEDLFFRAVGSRSEDLRKTAKSLLELLNRGLTRYQTRLPQNGSR
jgi:NifU-like protein involved in Fe-S cluster formation